MTVTKSSKTKRDLILETWRQCGSQSVGALELSKIQSALKATLGTVDSPASIARVMADEGIRLRHPEILDCDSTWRHQQIYELFGPGELEFETLQTAVDSMGRVDDLYFLFESEGDVEGGKKVIDVVREVKRDLATKQSRLAQEICQWLTVWLQNPQIFSDWLSLRRASTEFVKEFGETDGRVDS